MIPISDNIPVRTKPYVCYAVLIINIVVFLVDRVLPHGPLGNLWQFAMVPYSVVHGVSIAPMIESGRIVGFQQAPGLGLQPQWLTIFTSMFMHGGFMHIGGNMLYLWIFGNNIEDVLGHVRFLVFYLVCGALAAMAHILFNIGSPVPTVGASGAIAGVLGAYLILFPTARVKTLVLIWFIWDYVEIPAIILLGIWFASQILNLGGSAGSSGGVAYWAHIGGFIAGVILIKLMAPRNRRRQQRFKLGEYNGPPDFR
jgi:membrane associated rhomboid family serine protease